MEDEISKITSENISLEKRKVECNKEINEINKRIQENNEKLKMIMETNNKVCVSEKLMEVDYINDFSVMMPSYAPRVASLIYQVDDEGNAEQIKTKKTKWDY